MKNIEVSVSDEVHRVGQVRAAAEGTSLQEYQHRKLTREAQRPTVAEVLARVEERGGPKLDGDEIVATLREERDSRGSS